MIVIMTLQCDNVVSWLVWYDCCNRATHGVDNCDRRIHLLPLMQWLVRRHDRITHRQIPSWQVGNVHPTWHIPTQYLSRHCRPWYRPNGLVNPFPKEHHWMVQYQQKWCIFVVHSLVGWVVHDPHGCIISCFPNWLAAASAVSAPLLFSTLSLHNGWPCYCIAKATLANAALAKTT